MSTLPLIPLLASTSGVALSILGVGFLIFIHEFGHYLACRLTGTRTETFSIGFGPRLFGWESMPGQPRRFTTGRRRLDPSEHAMDFRVAAIPLGGYVKMVGENPDDERTGAADEFAEKPILSRVFIVSAGVIMNIIAAFVFYVVAFAGHVELPPAVAGRVTEGGAAWKAGIRSGDRVLELGGNPVRSFKDLKMESVFLEPGARAMALVDRDGERLSIPLEPIYDEETGFVQIGVGQAAGLKVSSGGKTLDLGPSDLVEVGGIPVRGASEVLEVIGQAWAAHPDTPVELRVPGGDSVSVAFLAGEQPEEKTWRIGIELYAPPVLRAVRGDAARHFQVGDRLVLAETARGELPLDRISALDGLAFRTPVPAIVVERDGERRRLEVALETPAQAYALRRGLAFKRPTGTTVAPIQPGLLSPAAGRYARYPSSPAADAGLRVGDRVVSVGTHTVDSMEGIQAALQLSPKDKPLELKVVGTDDQERTLTATLVPLEVMDDTLFTLVPTLEPYQVDGLMDAAGAAFARTVAEAKDIFRLIGAFFTGRISFHRNVAGPVTIVAVSAQAAEQSFLTFLIFLAYISVTLAVLNILPIPVLDGGWLMFILIEKVKGSPLKPETIGRLQWVGMMLLLVLMFFAFRNDFLNIVK